MSAADKLKDQLVTRLLRLRQGARENSVGLDVTGEFNAILVVANDQLGFDMRDLSVKEGERNIHPLRHADDPVHARTLTVAEMGQARMDGNAFRPRLEEAIVRLNAYVPPKDRIGFR